MANQRKIRGTVAIENSLLLQGYVPDGYGDSLKHLKNFKESIRKSKKKYSRR